MYDSYLSYLPDEVELNITEKLPFTDRKKIMLGYNKNFFVFDNSRYIQEYVKMILLTQKYYKSQQLLKNNIDNFIFIPYCISTVLSYENCLDVSYVIANGDDYHNIYDKLKSVIKNEVLKYENKKKLPKNLFYNNDKVKNLYILETLDQDYSLTDMVIDNLSICDNLYIYSPLFEFYNSKKELEEMGTILNYNLIKTDIEYLYQIKKEDDFDLTVLTKIDYHKLITMVLSQNSEEYENYKNIIKTKSLVDYYNYLFNNMIRGE